MSISERVKAILDNYESDNPGTKANLARFDEKRVSTLRPAFDPKGTITAGNASGINDGAAACIVVGDERLKAVGVEPLVRILGHANAALEPTQFTVAPIHAIRKLSEKLSLKLSEVDLFEINEAFAVVAMVAIRELGLDPDELSPRDRERFWYLAISRGGVASPQAVAAGDQLAAELKKHGYVVGPAPSPED